MPDQEDNLPDGAEDSQIEAQEALRKQIFDLPLEEIHRRMISRDGFTQDEIDALFPNEQQCWDFYFKVSLKQSDFTDNDDASSDPEDTLELTPEQKARAAELQVVADRNRAARKAAATDLRGQANSLRVQAAGSHLPLEDRAAPAELHKSLQDINELMKGFNEEEPESIPAPKKALGKFKKTVTKKKSSKKKK